MTSISCVLHGKVFWVRFRRSIAALSKDFKSCKYFLSTSRRYSKMTLKKVSHVIFDMDGLLIESESIYDKILNDIAGEHGKLYTREVKLKILGTPECDTARIAIEELELPLTVDEFLNIYREKVKEELKNPMLMPGAKDLVQHLKKHEVPIAVATSSSYEAMMLKTKHHQDVFSLFSHIVCGSTDPQVKHGKPAPDIFLVCATRFPDKPCPEKCLVFEDAPNGIKGATEAGMQTVMIPPKEVTEQHKELATMVLDSLDDFKPELFGLPPRSH